MKKALFLSLICLSSVCTFAASNASGYVVDDRKVEQLFSSSVDASLDIVATPGNNDLLKVAGQANFSGAAQFRSSGDKSFVAALLLNLFLGGLGIHRLYLGTATWTWVGYILTCGGIFGVVPLVDLIVLIVHNQDMSAYEDNTKFFMWG